MAYASLDQLKAVCTVQDEEQAAELLERASTLLDIEFERTHQDVDRFSDAKMDYLEQVCCDMVKRVICSNGISGDYTQASMTAGVYTQSWTNSDGIGNMRITPDERRNLGIQKHKQTVSSVRIGGFHD